MIEPKYIAQTHEPEHTKDNASRRKWFEKCVSEARERDCNHARFTVRSDGKALLVEAWDTEYMPVNQGDPRWQAGDSQ